MTSESLRLRACVGRGGFGEVYEADSRWGTVAVKVLRADVDPRSQAAARLRDEARWLSLVDHPAVPRVHALGVVEGRLALVSDFVDGEDLSRALRGDDPPEPLAVVQVVAWVADALEAAWSRTPQGLQDPLRLVHRDVKPNNIRLTREGGVAVLDLGIARTDQVERDARTETAGVIGSPSYLAPERFYGGAPDAADDIFGLGCVLFEALALRRLLGGLSAQQYRALALEPERLDAVLADRLAYLPRDLPDALGQLCRAMVSADPSRRPTAGQVRDACEALAGQLPGRPLAVWAAAHPWPDAAAVQGPWMGRDVLLEVVQGREKPPVDWVFWTAFSAAIVVALGIGVGLGLVVAGG